MSLVVVLRVLYDWEGCFLFPKNNVKLFYMKFESKSHFLGRKLQHTEPMGSWLYSLCRYLTTAGARSRVASKPEERTLCKAQPSRTIQFTCTETFLQLRAPCHKDGPWGTLEHTTISLTMSICLDVESQRLAS